MDPAPEPVAVRVACPFCREAILLDAVACPHCLRDLAGDLRGQVPVADVSVRRALGILLFVVLMLVLAAVLTALG